MLSTTAEVNANRANRARLDEIMQKITQISNTGRYSTVLTITPKHNDQTLWVKKELEQLGYTVISSPFRNKLFISWEPDSISKSPLWYLKRASLLSFLII